jgi:hypothetical protein
MMVPAQILKIYSIINFNLILKITKTNDSMVKGCVGIGQSIIVGPIISHFGHSIVVVGIVGHFGHSLMIGSDGIRHVVGGIVGQIGHFLMIGSDGIGHVVGGIVGQIGHSLMIGSDGIGHVVGGIVGQIGHSLMIGSDGIWHVVGGNVGQIGHSLVAGFGHSGQTIDLLESYKNILTNLILILINLAFKNKIGNWLIQTDYWLDRCKTTGCVNCPHFHSICHCDWEEDDEEKHFLSKELDLWIE